MPAHNKAGLLFVNKTPASRSLSNSKADSADLKEIHQHVQKSRDYEQEKAERRKLKRARLLPLGWTPVPVAPRQAPAPAPVAVVLPLPTPPETPAASSSGSRPLAAVKLDATRRDEARAPGGSNQRKDDSPKLSHAMPTQGSLEPFGQFLVPMNVERHRILEYFVVRFFPAVTRSDVSAFMHHPRVSSTSPAVEIVRRALCDELHVSALLAAASARMKFVEQYHFSREDLPERLADATLRLLRQYLAQGKPITHELVQTILYLWACESYRRNWSAVRTHGKMIMYLADNYLGGFRGLDPSMQRMLWLADRFQAAATQSPPFIKERWETDDLLPGQYTCAVAALREHDNHPMGHGFADISDLFSQEFRTLLDGVLDLCCVIHCHWINIPEQPLLPDRHWAIARSYFIADELIGFKESGNPGGHVYDERTLQECVRLALIIWMAFVPASTPYSTFARIPTLRAAVDAKALRNKLAGLLAQSNERQYGDDSQLLLFWVAGLGAAASEVSDNQEWFAVQFQRLAKKLGVFSWEAFAPVQERFLMLDTLKPASHTTLTWLLQRAVHADAGG